MVEKEHITETVSKDEQTKRKKKSEKAAFRFDRVLLQASALRSAYRNSEKRQIMFQNVILIVMHICADSLVSLLHTFESLDRARALDNHLKSGIKKERIETAFGFRGSLFFHTFFFSPIGS